MKINEIREGSSIILDFTTKNHLSIILGIVKACQLDANGVPSLLVDLKYKDYEPLDDISLAVHVYSPNFGEACVFDNVSVEKNVCGSAVMLRCQTDNVLQSRRQEERYQCYLGGIISIKDGMIPVNTRDISCNGISLYTMRDAALLPGTKFRLHLMQTLPEGIKENIGDIDGREGVILRIQNADYGRMLLGAAFV